MSNLEEKIKNLPDEPGVYFFKKGDQNLYIGKATSLRDRVRSYFAGDLHETRGPLLVRMIEEADDIDFRQTDSVLEALILEANLIRKYHPRYNSKEKDNKSYAYVAITKEDYPRVLVVRGRELQTVIDPDDLKYTFGPYPSGGSLREALKIIRRIFPYRGESDEIKPARRRSALNQQLGLAPDFNKVSKEEYARTINHLRLFFQGKKSQLLRDLEREMKSLAKAEEFEKAAEIKQKIFALQHINDMALLKEVVQENNMEIEKEAIRIEAYDIAHTSGQDMTGVMVVVEDGFAKKSDYRKFKIRRVKGSNDPAALAEVLERRFNHPEWPYPKLIVVDGGKAQVNSAKNVLEYFGINIPIVSVVKNEAHRPREILTAENYSRDYSKEYESEIILANSEAHRFATNYHDQLRRRGFI